MDRVMKLQRMMWAIVAGCALLPEAAQAQFSCGSTGTDGALVVATGQTVTLSVPNNGIFNFTTVTVSGTLNFTRNTAFNPPVIILASGDVVVNGGAQVNVNGTAGTAIVPGLGGPGGFDGGAPGIAGAEPGAGHGPGGGGAGIGSLLGGHGAYRSVGAANLATNGSTYGSPLLFPLVGGSGGGGDDASGGGGGGGAILLCSPGQVVINGAINARGAFSANSLSSNSGVGSGGAVRLVGASVRGTGIVDATASQDWGGAGRIRLDMIDRTGLALQLRPAIAASIGSLMAVFPSVIPRLDIVSVAGNGIPPGTPSPLTYTLPFNAPASQAITVRATGFSGIVPVSIVITPDSGNRIVVNTEINADAAPAEATVNVNLPQNVSVRVSAWTR